MNRQPGGHPRKAGPRGFGIAPVHAERLLLPWEELAEPRGPLVHDG